MEQKSLDGDLPLGFGLAMAQRPEALDRFAALPGAEREAVLDQARNARSKQEMRACVERLIK